MKTDARSPQPSSEDWSELIEAVRRMTDRVAVAAKKEDDQQQDGESTATPEAASRLTQELKNRVSTIETILKARPRRPVHPVFISQGRREEAKPFVIPKALRPVPRPKRSARPSRPARPVPPEPMPPPESQVLPDKPPDAWTFRPPTWLERTMSFLCKRYQAEEKEIEQAYSAGLSQKTLAEEPQKSNSFDAIEDYNSQVAEYRERLKEWKMEREAEERQWALKEKRRLEKLAELEQQHKRRSDRRARAIGKQNSKVESLRSAWKLLRSSYSTSPQDAAVYFDLVFSLSPLPHFVPRQVQCAYLAESRQLAIERQLPLTSTLPAVKEYAYVKRTGELRSKPRPEKDVKRLYSKLVASLTLRTIHEAFLADVKEQVEVVAFNGFVETRDHATGRHAKPCLVSVRVCREEFMALDLDHVEELACLRRLGAELSPQPEDFLPVRPVIDFNMFDKRFVEEKDLIPELDSRPNLMDLNPFEFEHLVSNLFNKLGLESKTTRTNKDGGVDAVAFDNRPIVGGKVVIQAKRWKHVVGVGAVRDLYGTMINEGANKGILVTTSHYGTDTYMFCKNKPIELIDGRELLYHLASVGVKATIRFLD